MAAPCLCQHLLSGHCSLFLKCFGSSCCLPPPHRQLPVVIQLWPWWHAVPFAVTSHLWRRAPCQEVQAGSSEVPSTSPCGTHQHLDVPCHWVLWGGMVLGAGQDTSASGGSHEGCISRWLLCCSGHPSLTGIFIFNGTPKCPGGSCSPALAPQPPSPEIPPGLVTPIDLQLLLEAFSTQSISKDSSCGSR